MESVRCLKLRRGFSSWFCKCFNYALMGLLVRAFLLQEVGGGF